MHRSNLKELWVTFFKFYIHKNNAVEISKELRDPNEMNNYFILVPEYPEKLLLNMQQYLTNEHGVRQNKSGMVCYCESDAVKENVCYMEIRGLR